MRALVITALAMLVPAVQQPSFRSRVDLVNVDVLVIDRGRPVTGLTAQDFELRDEGVVQRIDRVGFGEVPIDVWMVFDTTGSVAGERLTQLAAAGRAVVDQLTDRDRVALMTFSHRPFLRVALTSDRASVRRALSSLTAYGSTAVIDALFAALALQERASGRRLLLAFTDGKDNMSWLSSDQVIQAARRSEMVVYAVAPRIPVRRSAPVAFRQMALEGADSPLLRELAEETGGELLRAGADRDLPETFTRVLAQMKSRYLLSYYPQGVGQAGWHRLQVRLKGKRGDVQARRGYFAN